MSSSKNFSRRLVPGSVALVLLASAGCASKGAVAGTVTYQGKTVVSGTVIIRGSDSLPYNGTIEDDGTYLVRDVPTGLAKITVVSLPRGAGRSVEFSRRKAKQGAEEVETPPRVWAGPQRWFPLPEKYQRFDESDLTLTVTGGLNEHDIALE